MQDQLKDLVKEILEAEWQRINLRRKAANLDEGDPAKDTVGLALSGGGIRSATFNLGLLQAMSQKKFLNRVDILSTVSGGGYIGASLTWFMTRLQKPFPFGISRRDSRTDSAKILHWLRNHGKYLTPGSGLNLWSLAAAVLAGILINLAILVPIFALIFWCLSRDYGIIAWVAGKLPLSAAVAPLAGQSSFSWLLAAGILALGLFVLQVLFFALTSRLKKFRTYTYERYIRRSTGKVLMWAVSLILTGSIPYVYGYATLHFTSWMATVMSSVSLSGIVGICGALTNRKAGSEIQGLRSMLLVAGLTLLVYGLFLWLYHWVHSNAFDGRYLIYALALSVILALVADINHVSMHRFYRNRLMEAYFPFRLMDVGYTSADQCLLKDLDQTSAPYHILCANIQTLGSKDAKLRERGGDSFIFSPLYTGSEATTYMKTEIYVGGQMNLATAMAISGAAVDANTYATRSRPLSFLMALLNIRLGYWIANPKKYDDQYKWLRPPWYYYMFADMLGSGLNEARRSVHLSDGGHFENLGLYELLRRRCRIIVVCDGACDDEYAFGDLAKCIEMARVDFGAKIDIDVRPMRPDPQTGISTQPCVLGRIVYRDDRQGLLLYVKSTLVKDLSEDIYAYRREFPDFPNQSTGDQFFDERQFEAYRELGFRIGQRTFAKLQIDTVEALEQSLKTLKMD